MNTLEILENIDEKDYTNFRYYIFYLYTLCFDSKLTYRMGILK
jgi:hypothetical protein